MPNLDLLGEGEFLLTDELFCWKFAVVSQNFITCSFNCLFFGLQGFVLGLDDKVLNHVSQVLVLEHKVVDNITGPKQTAVDVTP